MPAYNRVTRSIFLIYLQIKKKIRKFLCFKHILLKVKIDIGLQIHKLYINAIISSGFFYQDLSRRATWVWHTKNTYRSNKEICCAINWRLMFIGKTIKLTLIIVLQTGCSVDFKCFSLVQQSRLLFSSCLLMF